MTQEEIQRLVEAFLAKGHKIKRYKAQKPPKQTKKARAIVGPATSGRAALWGE